MIVVAHFIAISFYIAAAALAALPFARRVSAPVNGVIASLALGLGAHAIALVAFARESGSGSLTGLGPALSFAGFVLAVALILVEAFAREVSVALIAAPLPESWKSIASPFRSLCGLARYKSSPRARDFPSCRTRSTLHRPGRSLARTAAMLGRKPRPASK